MPDHLPILAGLALAGWAYGRGTRRLWSRTRAPHPWRVAAFACGLAAVALVLVTPLDHAARERLWAHMVQHEVLVVVAAPLLVLGNPLPAILWALPSRYRSALGPAWRRLSRSHARPEGWARWTVAALAVHTATMWAWHAPAPHQAALRSEWLHSLQHATFLGTALFFWWAMVGARRRSLYGGAVLANFGAAIQGVALGAFMTLAARVWYPLYEARAHGGMSGLEDQQVAGVIMWGPAGAAYLLAAVILFLAWLGDDDADEVRAGPDDRPYRLAAKAPVA